jgi:uncharacterized HhH-GPD family protein
MELHLAQEPEADRLLSHNPFALLVGMVLDQQVPLEWAFRAPLELRRRLGHNLEPARLAALDAEKLAALFSQRPALHRYPGAMAGRVQELSRVLVEHYGGRAEAVWEGVRSGQELLDRVRQLPGFGEQKAKIFVALLGKQLGVRPSGWQAASTPFSDAGSFRSVADIVDEVSLGKVREFKQAMKKAAKAGGTAAGGNLGAAPRPKGAKTAR